jgi:hypothetical protein
MKVLILSLAVWRVCRLIAYEDGPWDIIVKMRSRAGNSVIGRLMDCIACLSLWISFLFAVVFYGHEWFLYCLVLSAVTLFIEASYTAIREHL